MNTPLHIWITGASRGIGAAIAERLSEHYNVTASSRSGAAQSPPHLVSVPCDVADRDSVEKAHEMAVGYFGPVNVVVLCAGIGRFEPVSTMQHHTFQEMLSVNMQGMFNVVKCVLPSMLAVGAGMIVDVNSVASLRAFPSNAAYAATKAGTLAFCRSLREEVRSSGIKVVELIVGATDTDIWDPPAREQFRHRMMMPSDVARVVSNVVEGYAHSRVLVEEVVVRPQLGDL